VHVVCQLCIHGGTSADINSKCLRLVCSEGGNRGLCYLGRLWPCCHRTCHLQRGSCSLPVSCPPPRPIPLHNLPLNIQRQMSKKTRKIAREPSNERVRQPTRIPCANLMLSQHSHATAAAAEGSVSVFTKVKAKLKHFRKGRLPNTTVLEEVCRACVCNRRPFDESWQGVIPI